MTKMKASQEPKDPRAGAQRQKFTIADEPRPSVPRKGAMRRAEPGDPVPSTLARPADTEEE